MGPERGSAEEVAIAGDLGMGFQETARLSSHPLGKLPWGERVRAAERVQAHDGKTPAGVCTVHAPGSGDPFGARAWAGPRPPQQAQLLS